MTKTTYIFLASLMLLSNQASASTEAFNGVEGRFEQVYGTSNTLYAYTYTSKPIDLNVTYCFAEADCSSLASPDSQTISLLFSAKLGPNASALYSPPDNDLLAQTYPNQTSIPIPSAPLTLIGGGLIQEDGTFFIDYSGRNFGISKSFAFQSDQDGNIANWDVTSEARFSSIRTTNESDSITLNGSFFTLEGSSTNVSSWVGTPITRYELPFTAFVPVSPVPEPATNAMLFAGLGLIAFISRRKSKTIC